MAILGIARRRRSLLVQAQYIEIDPKFSVFGVGPYSFAPWKVAISGFYKRFDFRVVSPVDERPVVLDDTSYFLPCKSQEDAETLVALLNSKDANGLLKVLGLLGCKASDHGQSAFKS